MEDLIRSLINQYRSIDIVESEFKRLLDEDPIIRNDYATWCEEEGYPLKKGYKEYIQRIFASENSIWETFVQFEDEN